MEAATELTEYAEGDWIVHCSYGIGQIMGIEEKDISGEPTRYYRIKTSDSTYWMPVKQMESDELRPLATHAEILQSIEILRRPPRKMASNHTARKSRIQKVREHNEPEAIARLVRDLRARQREKGILNQTERSAYSTFKQRLIEEWALVTDSQLDKIAARLESIIGRERTAAD